MLRGAMLLVACLCAVVNAKVSGLESLTSANVLALLKQWKLDHVFGPDFESGRYDGSTILFATKADIDSEFPQASPLHRRALFGRLQQLQWNHQQQQVSTSRRLSAAKKTDFKGYTGLRMHTAKSLVAFGEQEDIKMFRDADGNLQIVAKTINFLSSKLTLNGAPLQTTGGKEPEEKEPECGVTMAREYKSKSECIVKTCLPGFQPSMDGKKCIGAITYGVNFADSASRKFSDWPTIAVPTSTKPDKVYTAKFPNGVEVKSTGFNGSRQYTQLASDNPLYYYNSVLSTFTFGSDATTTFSGLIPGQTYEFHITAHDTSTNNIHKHHVGVKNVFTVIGTTTQKKYLTQTNVGNSIQNMDQLDDWDHIIVTATDKGQITIKQNGRLTAIRFRVQPPKEYAVNFADNADRKFEDWPVIACPTSTEATKKYTVTLKDGISIMATGFTGSRLYTKFPGNTPLYYMNNVLATFMFGSNAKTTISGLVPGKLYEFHIIAHDTSTNNIHKHHVGVKNVLTVTGVKSQKKTLVQTNSGNSATNFNMLDDWKNILVTAPKTGQVSVQLNGRITAIIFRQSPYASPLYGVNFANVAEAKYLDYAVIACPTSTKPDQVYTATLPDGITVKSTGFNGSRQYTQLASNNPLYYYNKVLSTFTFGSAATTTISGLKPGEVYEFHIIAHDTSTDNIHKHHVGVQNVFSVTGTSTQKKTLVQTDVGKAPYDLHMLDDWNDILVTVPSNGQVTINQNGRLSAITFRQRSHGRKLPPAKKPAQCLKSCLEIKKADKSAKSGVYSICPNGKGSSKISVYCDQTTLGGGWMLMLTQDHATDQYSKSVNPLTQNLNADKPSPTARYSRDWSKTEVESPLGGSEFLLKRGTSGQFVRFVQAYDKKFCGFGHQTTDCNNKNADVGHGYYTEGEAYDENNKLIPKVKYFNGCNYGGGCGSSGVDGIGFGSLQNHLRATHGDTGYGVTAWPGGLRWNQEKSDTGKNVPYTYWYKPMS